VSDAPVVSSEQLPIVLKEADVARLMRCSVRQVQRLNKAQRLPLPINLPGRPRWSRDEMVTWVSNGARSRRRS
jgi:hypothetical protein